VIERPRAQYFRYAAPGVLAAKLAAEEPATRLGRLLALSRRVAFGRPLASEEEVHERLPKWKALAVFSSDVMSSVAYATEAILFTLLAAGMAAFGYLMPISLVIVGLLVVVTFSYRQTIRAYPSGGGSYIVARANLGTLAGLTAAAALLCDYVLTVAVSVSAGIWSLVSAFPPLLPFSVQLIVLSILGVMAVNLRGIRQSGGIFAGPTYLFIATLLAMIGLGVARTLAGDPPVVTGVSPLIIPVESLGVLLILRAFADGCSAMTGTEAVANGVPAFQPVEWRNARTTMLWMSALLGVMFLGTSFLAGVAGAVPSGTESIISQVARATFGTTPLYYVLILATMGILVLAAQTSFADFPRIASILARDGHMPRRFAFRGERLAFNAGIVALAFIAIAVVIAFGGRVEALIPLYAIGVFASFTLSQAGMVRHWFVERGANWRRSAVINGFGAVATATVTIIFAVTKFSHGAWIVVIVIPVLVAVMLLVKRAYTEHEALVAVRPGVIIPPPHRPQRVVVVAPAFDRATIQAVQVAHTIGTDIEVVHVTPELEEGERFRERAALQIPDVNVVLVESPYRTLIRPLVRYLEVSVAEDPERVTIVLLPEHHSRHWWDRILFDQDYARIRRELVGRPRTVVLEVPYLREARAAGSRATGGGPAAVSGPPAPAGSSDRAA
jgi:amino acid transporter